MKKWQEQEAEMERSDAERCWYGRDSMAVEPSCTIGIPGKPRTTGGVALIDSMDDDGRGDTRGCSTGVEQNWRQSGAEMIVGDGSPISSGGNRWNG